ncbi:hypothetical protein [Streptomyces sp. NPDC059224]|uniref:hypothetical protein n=1 Tax=Streptomyces sp. NPDC059224 TaxID=3346775 RepID=UPI0036BAD60C
MRERKVLWGMPPDLTRPWTQRVAKPASPLGTGWILAGVCAAPGGVRWCPAAARPLLFRRALGPSGGWWLRERVVGVVAVHTSRRVTGAVLSGPVVRLDVSGPRGGRESLTVDHVAATGYRLDLDALPFLSPTVRRAVACAPGSRAPALRGTFESSVPGLYFTGSLAAPMFGPMMRSWRGRSSRPSGPPGTSESPGQGNQVATGPVRPVSWFHGRCRGAGATGGAGR